ncbi:MAG: hypothetical protein RLZZ21_559 [Planctomycetota bacterium]|jgi:hypothetical protein
MHNPLGKLALLALLGGGFAVTGDLGRLTDRGMRLLESTTVPAEQPTADAVPPTPAAESLLSPSAPPATATSPPPATAPAQPSPPVHLIDDEAPIPVPATEAPASQPPRLPPPGSAPTAVDLATLRAGTRVLVWLPASAGRPGWHRCLAIDVVAPQTGEALLHHDVTVVPGGRSTRTTGVPSRVTIRAAGATSLFGNSGASGRLLVGGMLECTPVGVAHGAGADRTEQIGPIAAIAVER